MITRKDGTKKEPYSYESMEKVPQRVLNFLEDYLLSGDLQESWLKAGYKSKTDCYFVVKNPCVREYIRVRNIEMREKQFRQLAGIAESRKNTLSRLVGIVESGKDSDSIAAAKQLLDETKVESDEKAEVDKLSVSELGDMLKEAQRKFEELVKLDVRKNSDSVHVEGELVAPIAQ